MRLTHFFMIMALGTASASHAFADSCGDLSARFSGAERFSMKLAELDELKTCINMILREKISANSQEARGSTSPPLTFGDSTRAQAPVGAATSTLQDAE
jgi:hypothetical protein